MTLDEAIEMYNEAKAEMARADALLEEVQADRDRVATELLQALETLRQQANQQGGPCV